MSKAPDIIKILNDSYKSKVRKKSTKKDKVIKPSMLGGKCLRKLYYIHNRVQEDHAFPLNVSRIVDLGNYVGELFNKQLSKIRIPYRDEKGEIPSYYGGFIKSEEFPVFSPELDIKVGFIDEVVVVEDKLWLLEYKSINARGYKELNGPKMAHHIQTNVYYKLFNDHLKNGDYKHIEALKGYEKAEGVIIIYYNKDNSYSKQYTIDTNPDFYAKIEKRVKLIQKHTKHKKLPSKKEDWCKSCSYRDKCEADFNDV